MSIGRLLLIRGYGGPGGAFLADALSGIVDGEVVTVYARSSSGRCFDSEGQQALRRLGPVYELTRIADAEPFVIDQLRPSNLDGAVTFCELALSATVRIAERLGLPGTPSATVNRLQNKLEQRRVLHAAGMPVPAVDVVDPADPARSVRRVGVPSVLKPVRGAGSTATVKITEGGQIASLLAEARALHSGTVLCPGSDPAFILESFIPQAPVRHDRRLGGYVSVESAVGAGRIVHLGVTDKLPMAPPFREQGHLVPSVLPEHLVAAVHSVAREAIEALELSIGVVHTEIQLSPEGPRVIEVNGRSGGPLPYLYAAAADTDMVRLAAGLACGAAPERPARFERHALYWAPQSPSRDTILTALGGVEAIAAMPGVLAVRGRPVPRDLHWKIAGPGDGTLLTVVAVAPTREALYHLLDRMRETLAPEYSDDFGDGPGTPS